MARKFRLVGKPIKDASLEIARAVAAVRLAAEEATRIHGEVVRRPLVIIAGISGFNFPLLLDCHKIAPALAAGNAIILKPAPDTPITALELGNNSPLIIEADADLERAVARTVAGGYYAVGQACIAVQRIFAQRSIYQEFARRLALQVGKLHTGDPRDPATDSSTLVSEQATQRVMAVLRDAQEQGAQLLVGGELLPDGCITPAVLLGVTPSMQICQSELFGPAVAIAPYDTLDEAIDLANSTPYGLQAGIFTNNLQKAFYAAERLDFGGVHINEVSSYRADHMPYGGVKASGMGREGPRYAIEEMSETKIIIITT